MNCDFTLTDEQRQQADAFIQAKAIGSAPIGGQFSFRFTPTTIGTIAVVVDHNSGEELDLTDYMSM